MRASDTSLSDITMYTSLNCGETYPGYDFSISQLVYAIKRKLWDTTSGGRSVWDHAHHLPQGAKS